MVSGFSWIPWLAADCAAAPGTAPFEQHEAAPLAAAAVAVAASSAASLCNGEDSPEASEYEADGGSCQRSLSLEQHLFGDLLHKPLYSELPKHCGRKLVLLVDGERTTHVLIAGLLSGQRDFLVISAYSAEDALVQLEQMEYLPNSVLVGLHLAGSTANGLQVCRVIRKAYSRVELPIIMLLPTNLHNSSTEACIEAGANDWIVDPIGQAELLARLHTHIMLPQLVAAEADRYSNYQLLQEMLPRHIIERLKEGSQIIAEQHEQVSILFSDICNFTTMSSEKPTEYIVNMLQMLFSEFDACCDEHGVYKVETIGDAYMIVCGHEGVCDDHALRMVNMATSMLQATERVGRAIGHDLKIRVGIHTGPAYSGVVGTKCPRYCFFGDTVNTASRMESSSFPMCVHISDATKRALDEAWSVRSTNVSTDGSFASAARSHGGPAEGQAHSWHGAPSRGATSSSGTSGGAADGHGHGRTARRSSVAIAFLNHASRRKAFASEGGSGRRKSSSKALREPPRTVSLGARYQKGKGYMVSHLLLVGAYQEALSEWEGREAHETDHNHHSNHSSRPNSRAAKDTSNSTTCTTHQSSHAPAAPAHDTASRHADGHSNAGKQPRIHFKEDDSVSGGEPSSSEMLFVPRLATPSCSQGGECAPPQQQEDRSDRMEAGHSGSMAPATYMPTSPLTSYKSLQRSNLADSMRSSGPASVASALTALEQDKGQLVASLSRIKRSATAHVDDVPNDLPKIKTAPIARSQTVLPETPYGQKQSASPGSVQADMQKAVEAALARMREKKAVAKPAASGPAH